MRYDYECQNTECKNVQEEEHSMTGFKEFHPKCVECGTDCNYTWTPTVIQFALKDGPSGVAPGKALSMKNYYDKRTREMKRRQKDRYGHLNREALPNYGGQETGTWAEAQFQALKDKGADAAASFNDKVAVERSKPGKIKI